MNPCRPMWGALALSASLCGVPALPAQTLSRQQAPAPVVRVRPQRPAGTPDQAPPDAAPLVHRTPQVQAIDPRSLSGTAAPKASSAQPATRTTQSASPAGTQQPAPPAAAAASAVEHHAETPAEPPPDRASVLARMASPALNRNVVVLDPAHGGADSGSRIGDRVLEKNVTLGFALRLRSLLAARGFSVVLTRDADLPATGQALSMDDRAGIANHAGAAACLFLHATGRGDGVHLYTSELAPATGTLPEEPWLTAQAPWVPASQQLERSVSSALGRSHVALVSSAASIRPMDSLACPALILEIAPEDGKINSVTDTGYQDRIAAAIAGALVFWQNQVQPPGRASAPVSTPRSSRHRSHAAPAASSAATEAKP